MPFLKQRVSNFKAVLVAAGLSLLLLCVDPAIRKIAAEVFLENFTDIRPADGGKQQRTVTQKTLRFHGTEWLAQYHTSDKSPNAVINEMDQLYGAPQLPPTGTRSPQGSALERLSEAIMESSKGASLDLYGVGHESVTRIYGRLNRPQRDSIRIVQAFKARGGSIVVTMTLKDPEQIWNFARQVDYSAMRGRLSHIVDIPMASRVLSEVENETEDFRATTYYLENVASPRDMAVFYAEHYPGLAQLPENGETEVFHQRFVLDEVTVEVAHVAATGARSTSCLKIWVPVRN